VSKVSGDPFSKLPNTFETTRGAQLLSSPKSNDLFINKLLFLEGTFDLRQILEFEKSSVSILGW
jgi:hypothetical protein